MTTYNTGNPLGSADPRDLYDNAENLDEAVNSDGDTFQDRLGKSRITYAGMEAEFSADQSARQGRFGAEQIARAGEFSAELSGMQDSYLEFLSASGYAPLGEYVPGIVIESHSSYVIHDGQPYVLKPSVPVPYTTAGTWTGDDFKLIGDDAIRQELANLTAGAGMVGHSFGVDYAEGTVGGRLNRGKFPGIAAGGTYVRESLSSADGISVGPRAGGPVATFIDDDGQIEAYTILKPLYESKGITGGLAIIANRPGDPARATTSLDWDKLHEMVSEGWEVLSHGYDNASLPTLNPEQVEYQLSESRRIFEEQGIRARNFVSVGGRDGGADNRKLIRKYYRSHFTTIGEPQFIPFRNYRICRAGPETRTLQQLKELVDTSIANQQMIAIITHARDMTEAQLSDLSAIIDYIQAAGVPIVTPDKALDMCGNILDVGEESAGAKVPSFKIDSDGKAWDYGQDLFGINWFHGDDPLTNFPIDRVSVNATSLSARDFPVRSAGVLTTIRTDLRPGDYGTQTWVSTSGGDRSIWFRTWATVEGVWQSWRVISRDGLEPLRRFDGTNPITDFPEDATVTNVTGVSSLGLPGSTATGILKTTRGSLLPGEAGAQTFESTSGGRRDVWQRSWRNAEEEWDDWKPVTHDGVYRMGSFDGTNPITDFPEDATVTNATGVSSLGLPVTNAAGILKTTRVDFRPGDGGEQTFSSLRGGTRGVWQRTWLNDQSVWGEWRSLLE